ncbi:hypothetical protein Tco_1082101 [Tanacetum coccineum]|uniref:Uncharacterized protein n=1 Tax=Tanacetum coccineum TaxID=301880 RepID=A0ABQ5HZD9_9ASTR
MLNPNPDTGIDSILNLNTELTSLVDVPVTTNVEMPPSSITTLPPPPIPIFQPPQQTPVPIPTIVPNRLRDATQAENEDFINKLDENMKKIIKEQVKVQVKEQVSKIFPKIEKFVNDQLEAEVLTRSSNEAKTSHAIAAKLSELELKKILIDKMEHNKSIDRSIQQKTLYKDWLTLMKLTKTSLKHMEILSRLKDVEMMRLKTKNPLLDQTGGPREEELEKNLSQLSAQAEEPIHADEDLEEPLHQEFDTGFAEDQLVDESTQHPDWFQKPTKPLTPDRNWNKTLPAKHGPSNIQVNERFMQESVELEYFLEEVCKATTDQLDWNNPEGQQYPHDLGKPLPLIPNSRGRRVIPFDHFINNDLAYLSGGVSSRTYATLVTKTKAAYYGHIKWIEDFVPNSINDDKLYTFKEGDYNRLRLQDIEDMLLLLVQGKLTNLNIKERLDLGVSLRMFTRSVVLRRRVEDLQLGVENKKNRLMCIDELHKFSDGTLNDVRSAIDDIQKRIRMEQKVIEEPGRIRWWEIIRGRPSAARKDHMIYHMMSSSKQITKKQTPTIDLEQESEKSHLEIINLKKEYVEKQQTTQFTFKSTNKVALKLFDLKTLIEDENEMDKGVVDIVEDHKRKRDDDDEDDDNEDPSAVPNQGKTTKRRRTKEFVSSKTPSATKDTSKGKALSKGSKTGKSASAKESIDEPIAEVVMDDAGENVVRDEDQPQNTSQPKKDKTLEWFKQPPRPPTPNPE